MKNINLAFLCTLTLFASCQSSNISENRKDSITSIESGPGKILDEKFLIVPGKSIGEISLGEDMEVVGKRLGKPDAGDAAMGKAWGIWFSKDSSGKLRNELAVYSSYRDTSMKIKDVKQIRITSNQFKTQDGFGLNNTLTDTQMKFPDVEKISTYLNENKDSVKIYDSKIEGISFEFLNGKSIALTIHPKDKPLNATYITLHPEWKPLK